MNLYIDKKNHPHIKLTVFLSSKPLIVDCYVDTGFSGGISLPADLHSHFKQDAYTIQDFEIGDGSTFSSDVYKIKVQYGQTSKYLTLIFTPSPDILVGIEFLTGFKFTLDLKNFKIQLE
ncbi:hypothetical protein A2767_06585 [Candidatus Roizmanbacteria bacterium RIFCSPHIGHO2_01_FULL_35_10]|uniref:Peptidase A2 domain-containing protein n=1 Tax=Candidatus Roizmanbacteria bacterium RIFCSPLOWO2_01_FULL_35_13 TaxID=1802055 RepID=A0A1F7IAM0_9BACT|nr:MAG: hypothetical protein A2767_06585 [Candidatus Roizmanbacteria bacterium RIFCSPHIGHO2_01_FULL_35_10]OGK40407.1 MAG: hypothetical protein A3A74_01735 [Candidatus Roizmanbacteria bacterium RIFCSPLOWO2_01_FULL_35_13]